VRKKWKQVWPETPLSPPPQMALSEWIKQQASDVVDVLPDDKTGGLRVYAKHCSQEKVAVAAAAAKVANNNPTE
jgi:hypothetical protein